MGAPNSWMIYFMENPILRCMILGYPHGLETSIYTYITSYHICYHTRYIYIYNSITSQQPELQCGAPPVMFVGL